MLCLIFNIHTPLNYDIGFPNLKDKDPFEGAVSHKTSIYHDYNKQTNEIGPPQEIKLYKARLCGIVKRIPRTNSNETGRPRSKSSGASDGYIKHELIQWNNRTGGVFYAFVKSLDKYGRIGVELVDPKSGKSITNKLLNKHPQKYRAYT